MGQYYTDKHLPEPLSTEEEKEALEMAMNYTTTNSKK